MNSPGASLVNIDDHNSDSIRNQLLQEINQLEQELLHTNPLEHSLQQTYREMIHARREALAQLPHN